MCEQVEREKKVISFFRRFSSRLYTLLLAANLFKQICWFYINLSSAKSNQLTGFHMMATLAFNELTLTFLTSGKKGKFGDAWKVKAELIPAQCSTHMEASHFFAF